MAQMVEETQSVSAIPDCYAVTPEEIISAVEQIVEIAKPWKVIAFGSRARGDHRPHSDLDLAVIVSSYNTDSDKRPISRADLNVGIAMDLLVFDRARFEFMKDSIISVERQIEDDGVTIYDASLGYVDRAVARRLAR